SIFLHSWASAPRTDPRCGIGLSSICPTGACPRSTARAGDRLGEERDRPLTEGSGWPERSAVRAISPPTAEDMSLYPRHAKPSEYASRTSRSRTEARWAVFFAALGLAWEYEEHGHDLTVGKRRVSYLPDFYLPDVWGQTGKGLWFEVKGAAPTPEE